MTRKFVTCLKGRTLIQIDGGTYITPMLDKDEGTAPPPDFPDETTADQFFDEKQFRPIGNWDIA